MSNYRNSTTYRNKLRKDNKKGKIKQTTNTQKQYGQYINTKYEDKSPKPRKNKDYLTQK
jgi:hypothetical protein